MFNVTYVGTRPRGSGQYWVEIIDLRLSGDDEPPERLAPRLGYWCDVPHLRSLQRQLDGMIGRVSLNGFSHKYGNSDDEVIDEFVNLIGPLTEHKEIQSKQDMIDAIKRHKESRLSPVAQAIREVATKRFRDFTRTNEYWEALASAARNAE